MGSRSGAHIGTLALRTMPSQRARTIVSSFRPESRKKKVPDGEGVNIPNAVSEIT